MNRFSFFVSLMAVVFLLNACERSVGYDPTNDAGMDAGNNQNNNNQPDAEVQHGYLMYEVDHFIYQAPYRDAQIPITMLDLYANDEDAYITRITFELHGNIDPSEIVYVRLYREDPFELVASNAVWDGRFVSFDLSADPLHIPDGDQRTYSLRVELDADPCEDTIGFDISQDSHIEVTGGMYGPGYNVIEGPLSEPVYEALVVGKQVAFALAVDNPPPGDVFVGADDHVFISYIMSTNLDVTVQQTRLIVMLPDAASSNYVSDIKVQMRNSSNIWQTVVGPYDLTPADCLAGGTCDLALPDDYDVAACEVAEFRVTMDISSGAPLDMPIHVNVIPGSFLILDTWNDPNTIDPDNITSSPLHGNPQTTVF